MEALSMMITKAVSGGWFSVDNLRGETMVICYLLSVDDKLIFCEENSTHLCYLRHSHIVVMCFEVVLSLTINLVNLNGASRRGNEY